MSLFWILHAFVNLMKTTDSFMQEGIGYNFKKSTVTASSASSTGSMHFGVG